MSVKVNAGADMKRGDVFFCDPFQIEVKDELRGRHTPPSEEDIVKMAVSMLSPCGQLQPVQCRKINGDRLQLILGFTRTAAARLIREGFEFEGAKYHDAAFKLQVILRNVDDEFSFKNNIVENLRRKGTSAIDDAYNQETLRVRYGNKDSEIAKIYDCDAGKVARYARLLSLPKAQQLLVHTGMMSVQAAIDILDLPEDKREAAIKDATPKDGGKVKGAKVKAIVRDHHLSDKEGSTPVATPLGTKSKSKARSVKEIRTFFERMKEESKSASRTEKLNVLIMWINGHRTDESLEEAFFK